jgi:ATP-dependent Clp protease ATP-binding subunit ClpC
MYFREPKLKLTAGGEFLVNVISWAAYLTLAVLALFSLFSDISQLKSLGAFLLIFLIDRTLHLNKGERNVKWLKEKIDEGKEINISKAFTPSARKIISRSYRQALNLNKSFYIVLFKSLIEKDKSSAKTLKRLNISKKDFFNKLEENTKTQTKQLTKTNLLGSVSEIAQIAYLVAENTSEKYIYPRNILVALAEIKPPAIQKTMDFFDISSLDLREAIIFSRFRPAFAGIKRIPASLGGFAHRPRFTRKRIMNRSWTARPTPFLDKFSEDLTATARKEKVGLLIGHEKEYREMTNILSRIDKPNALLVGEPGTGKSTLIAHLAFKIIKDEVPKNLFDKRLIRLDIGSLISEAESQELAARLKRIAHEIITAGNIILFIPNAHNLFKYISGGEESFTAMDTLLPIIKSSNIPTIAETYPREFKQYIENHSDFIEQFQKIEVREINKEEAVRVLIYHSLILENKYKVTITIKAIKKAVDLSYRYLHTKPLPSSALDLLRQALTESEKKKNKTLEAGDITRLAQELSRIPIQKAEGEEVETLLNLEERIHERLINQNAAVEAVSRALREYRSGISKRGRPIASFLFVGPTGVGKTELSKILTNIQFGSQDQMIRLDMSEYQDKKSIQRLLGSPDGEYSGSLTEAVTKKPYSLILLDEFEKAHPDILNLFLQVFDDGRLTDSLGKTVNFENTIIIATSNAHSTYIKEEIQKGRTASEISEELKNKLTKYFKPELLNRFSNVIVFRNLNREEIKQIAKILINETCGSIQESHGIHLEIDDRAISKISELGYSPVFGARPLREEISKNIRSVLAEKILRNEIKRGDTVNISHNNQSFTFNISN